MTAPTRQNQTSNRMRGCLASAVSLVVPCGGKDDAFHIVASGHGKNWLGRCEVRITFQGEGGRQQEQFLFRRDGFYGLERKTSLSDELPR